MKNNYVVFSKRRKIVWLAILVKFNYIIWLHWVIIKYEDSIWYIGILWKVWGNLSSTCHIVDTLQVTGGNTAVKVVERKYSSLGVERATVRRDSAPEPGGTATPILLGLWVSSLFLGKNALSCSSSQELFSVGSVLHVLPPDRFPWSQLP